MHIAVSIWRSPYRSAMSCCCCMHIPSRRFTRFLFEYTGIRNLVLVMSESYLQGVRIRCINNNTVGKCSTEDADCIGDTTAHNTGHNSSSCLCMCMCVCVQMCVMMRTLMRIKFQHIYSILMSMIWGVAMTTARPSL